MFGCLVQLELEKTYDKQNPAYSDIIWKQFKNQYFVTLPAVVEEFHPGACYRKSSPYSDDKGTRNHTVGDMHYWAVWQGLKPLSEFNHERSRFSVSMVSVIPGIRVDQTVCTFIRGLESDFGGNDVSSARGNSG